MILRANRKLERVNLMLKAKRVGFPILNEIIS